MTIHKILIATDDSPNADYAAAYGFELARTLKAEVGIVNIVEPIILPPATTDAGMGMPISNSVDPMSADLIKAEESASEALMDRVIQKYGKGLQVSHFKEYGASGDGIIECSNQFGADLIVLGTHKRSGLDRLLMGSVAEHVVRHSTIPVLVVPFRENE